MKHIILGLSLVFFLSCANTAVNDPFTYNFKDHPKLEYDFEQNVSVEDAISRINSTSTVSGRLVLTSRSDSTSDLSLQDLGVTVHNTNLDSSRVDTIEVKPSPLNIPGLTNKGRFTHPMVESTFKLFMPLPTSNISEGEESYIPMNMPFSAGKEQMEVRGGIHLLHDGTKTFQDRECVVFEGSILIDSLKVPEHLEGKYDAGTTGTAVYYFDPKEGVMIGAEIDLKMRVTIIPLDPEEPSINMNNHNVIRYVLQDSTHSE